MSRPFALAFAFALALVGSSASLGRAQIVTSTTTPPRIAVVLRGDPTPAAIETAEALTTSLRTRGDVMLPSDAAVRAALLGREATAADGLDELRAARRRLGWDAANDTELLARIGAFTQSVALVVVRDGTPATAEVFDVAGRQYYDGVATLDAPDFEQTGRFVRSRARAADARAAALRNGEATNAGSVATGDTNAAAPSATASAATPEATPSAANAPAESATALSPAAAAASVETPRTEAPAHEEPRRARAFFRRSWPWFVAGVALAGTVTAFAILQRNGNETREAVIHVRPGGN